ncbi:cyclin-A1 [Histomonas meleagridis]|uniref:cyclin-A1 n=1 Tax=Histomonas meleagridis TaxID=135588 RepID=UPI00355A06F9|nr:cyclin-A1 [Histomonas meleagridis]KAH0806346.1 cyclin-A1 [Histomonas meleagridis]
MIKSSIAPTSQINRPQPAHRALRDASARANVGDLTRKRLNPIHQNKFKTEKVKLERIGSPESPQDATEYELEVYLFMKHNELKELPSPELFQIQSNITPRMRSTVIDWLVDVHRKMKMHTDTLYLTVYLIDRYLSKFDLDKSKFQRLGCAALLIASKNYEIYPPSIDDLVELADKSFTRTALIRMEASLFACNDFHVDPILSSMFLKRYLRLISPESKTSMLAYFISETALLYPDFIGEVPSKLAAASVCLAMVITEGQSQWDRYLEINTGYKLSDISQLAQKLAQAVVTSTTSRFQAIRKKYANQQMESVSLIQIPESLRIF